MLPREQEKARLILRPRIIRIVIFPMQDNFLGRAAHLDGPFERLALGRGNAAGKVKQQGMEVDRTMVSNFTVEGDTITVIDVHLAHWFHAHATPGFTQLRFAPGGRYAFLPNPAANIVEIPRPAGVVLARIPAASPANPPMSMATPISAACVSSAKCPLS